MYDQEHSDNALNVAAIMILSIGKICVGDNALARDLLIAGVQMAERLGYIGKQRCSSDELKSKSTEEGFRAHTYAAWGAFNFSR